MNQNSEAPFSPSKLAYRVNDFCSAIGIGRSTFYKMVEQGEIDTVKIGGRRLVPASSAERLLAQRH